jgi:hypothetical protein
MKCHLICASVECHATLVNNSGMLLAGHPERSVNCDVPCVTECYLQSQPLGMTWKGKNGKQSEQ